MILMNPSILFQKKYRHFLKLFVVSTKKLTTHEWSVYKNIAFVLPRTILHGLFFNRNYLITILEKAIVFINRKPFLFSIVCLCERE